MGEIDDQTREKLREWQFRRLEIKDQMQSHPEKVLELSRVLDLMDDEHAAILSAAAATPPQAAPAPAPTPPPPIVSQLTLQLQVAAASPENLLRLLDMAVHELRGQIEANGAAGTGGMSGSLGDYHFELGTHGEAGHG